MCMSNSLSRYANIYSVFVKGGYPQVVFSTTQKTLSDCYTERASQSRISSRIKLRHALLHYTNMRKEYNRSHCPGAVRVGLIVSCLAAQHSLYGRQFLLQLIVVAIQLCQACQQLAPCFIVLVFNGQDLQ